MDEDGNFQIRQTIAIEDPEERARTGREFGLLEPGRWYTRLLSSGDGPQARLNRAILGDESEGQC